MNPKADFTITFGLERDPFLRPGLSKATPIGVSLFTDDVVCYLYSESLIVPSLPIHHDIRKDIPSPQYLSSIEVWLDRLRELLPESFVGMRWGFEPSNALQPALFEVIGDFLMVVRFDLTYRRGFHQLIKRGDNDRTPEYQTSRLFFTFDFLPLLSHRSSSDHFSVRPLFETTWLGEKGRGYYLQGIWMDDSLTDFFTRLVDPEFEKSFPFHPVRCRFRSLSANTTFLRKESRSTLAALLQKLLELTDNDFKDIQMSLKNAEKAILGDLIESYRRKLDIGPKIPIPKTRIKSRRLAENGQVEFLVDEP